MSEPELDPAVYPPIDPDEIAPDDAAALLPDSPDSPGSPDSLPEAPPEPMPITPQSGGDGREPNVGASPATHDEHVDKGSNVEGTTEVGGGPGPADERPGANADTEADGGGATEVSRDGIPSRPDPAGAGHEGADDGDGTDDGDDGSAGVREPA